MDCSSSILSSMQLPINNGDNQAVTSDATVVEPDAQTIDVDQQQSKLIKTIGIVSFDRRMGFEEEHNHPFVDEDDISLVKSLRKLTFSKKQLLFRVSNNNIGLMKAFKMMKELFGGFEEVGATSVDCKNFKRGINLFIWEFDGEMVVELLLNKQEYINGFSCDFFTNDDGNISGLFWADKVAKHKYLSFGDVISFDATFRSNKYKMVFVPFTRIDNHHRSVTLAAALLSNETAESYKKTDTIEPSEFKREWDLIINDFEVLFTPSDVTLSCSCKQFERYGLLCRHNFYVLRICGVDEFPKRYVSIRWTRDAVTQEKRAGLV
ncbi:FAR1-related sequence 5-like protein [Tanacetum coccineum]